MQSEAIIVCSQALGLYRPLRHPVESRSAREIAKEVGHSTVSSCFMMLRHFSVQCLVRQEALRTDPKVSLSLE